MGSRNATPPTLHAHSESESILLQTDSVERFTLHAAAAGEMPRFVNQVVYTGGIMSPELTIGNYRGPVVVDIAGIEINPDTPCNRDHDIKRPVAHCTDVHSNGSQLFASGVFSLDNSDSREIITGRSFPWKPSIGLSLLAWRMVHEGETVHVNGSSQVGPFLLVTDSRLKHIAIVTEPGDSNVDPMLIAQLSSSTGNVSIMDFAAWVASLGLDVATITPEVKAILQSEYDEMNTETTETEGGIPTAAANAGGVPANASAVGTTTANATSGHQVSLHASRADIGAPSQETLRAQLRNTMAEEYQRGNQIRSLCARFNNPQVSIGGQTVDLCAHAMQTGMSLEAVELHAFRHQQVESTRESRSSGPFIHSRSRSSDGNIETLQAALMVRAGIPLDAPEFNNATIRHQLPPWLRANINDASRQRIMNNAHDFQMSIPDICAAGLLARGLDVPRSRPEMLHASFSTGVVGDLFGTTIGAATLRSYAEIADFSIGWTQEGENPDMEEHNRTRLEAAGDLSHHPTGGSAGHTTRQSKSEKAKVDRFSRMAKFDEADFMSDNLGLLKNTPRDFGMAAGRVRPNLVASLMLSNPTLRVTGRALFNSTDGSDLGTGNPLTIDNLSLAISRLMLKKDGDANLNLEATHLLVGPSLADPASRYTTSPTISNDSGKGEKNVVAAYGIQAVPEARLQNGMVDPISGANLAGSASDWFLVGANGNTIEVTFLEGAGRIPTVRVEQLTGGEFGICVTVKHYVGVRALDHIPFVRGRA